MASRMPLHTDPVSTPSGFSPFCNIVALAVLSQLPFYWVIRPVEPTAIWHICHLNVFGLRPRRSGSVLRCRICLPSPTPRNAGDMRRALTRRKTQGDRAVTRREGNVRGQVILSSPGLSRCLAVVFGHLAWHGEDIRRKHAKFGNDCSGGAHSLGAAPGCVSAAEGLGCEITVLGLTRHTTP